MTLCTAPGKIMLAGEYAVIDGSEAVMLAVDRYAVATLHNAPQHLSPFLEAAHRVLADEFGDDSAQAKAAQHVRVDTHAFREGPDKLGLGSSAAATVAAIGLALGADDFDVDRVHILARRAHGDAQEPKGARGSGADIAASSFGGCLRFSPTPSCAQVSLPTDLHLVFPWCGQSASTTSLVSQVRTLRKHRDADYQALCAAISDSAQALAAASTAGAAIVAIGRGGQAVAELGTAAGAALWLPVHSQMRDIAEQLGGAVKPTGAGGGDLALGAFANASDMALFVERLADRGIPCPPLAPAPQGVRLQSQASKVDE